MLTTKLHTLVKMLRSIFRRFRYGNASTYRNALRMRQVDERAGAREAWQHPSLNSPLRRVPAIPDRPNRTQAPKSF